MDYNIERWPIGHPRWEQLMGLDGVEDLDLERMRGNWHLGIYTLVALAGDEIAGVLRFWTQEIGEDEEKPLSLVDGEPAIEAKIVTFHVLDAFRRQGIGRALQLAAVDWAFELGCYQVRSRSAYAREGNHKLKTTLGFGIDPGRNRPDGAEDTAFFVLPLQLDEQLLERLARVGERDAA